MTDRMNTNSRIIVTTEDFERLHRLSEQHAFGRNAELVEWLEIELARAEVVEPHAIPRDVVTVNSRVVFQDEETGAKREVQLVWPNEVDGDASRVSVLAPVGTALLGLREGEEIDCPMPGGRHKRIKVLSVLYQPESKSHAPPPSAA